MSAAEHKRFEGDIGAFLLGALTADEHDAFERHVATCHVCQDELERLRGAADALPRAVEQFEPPPSLKAAIMEQVQAEAPAAAPVPRRSLAERLGLAGGMPRLSPALAAGVCALVVLVGAAGYGIAELRGGGGGEPARTVEAAVDATRIGDARATLVVPDEGGDAQLRVAAMPQPRPGQIYEVWYQRGDRIEPGPLFSVDRNGNGVAAVPGDLDGVTAILVTRERAGGARVPSEQPVVRARV